MEAIDNCANFTGSEGCFIGFRVERDKQNANVISQLDEASVINAVPKFRDGLQVACFGLLQGDPQMGTDEFIGVVVGVARRGTDTSIDQNLIEIVYIHCHNLSRLLDQQDVLLKERDRNCSAQVGFCEG